MVRVEQPLQTVSLSPAEMTLKEAPSLRDPVNFSRPVASDPYGIDHLASSRVSLPSAFANDIIFTPPSSVHSPAHSSFQQQNQSSPEETDLVSYQTADLLQYLHAASQYALSDCYGTAQQLLYDIPDLDLWPHFFAMSDADRSRTTLPEADAPITADDQDASFWNFPVPPPHLDIANQEYVYDAAGSGHSWSSRVEPLSSYHEYGQSYHTGRNDSLLVPTTSQVTNVLSTVSTAQPMPWQSLTIVDNRTTYPSGTAQHLSESDQLRHIPGIGLVNNSSLLSAASGLYPTSRLVFQYAPHKKQAKIIVSPHSHRSKQQESHWYLPTKHGANILSLNVLRLYSPIHQIHSLILQKSRSWPMCNHGLLDPHRSRAAFPVNNKPPSLQVCRKKSQHR